MVVNAPGGVWRLRELVLTLAIRGELVHSDQVKEDGQALLARIISQRELLVSNGDVSYASESSIAPEAPLPFTIPQTWTTASLGQLSAIVRGVTFPASAMQRVKRDDVVVCLKTSNVQDEIDWQNLVYIAPDLVKREDQWLRVGDIVMSMANSRELVGKVAIARRVPTKSAIGGFLGILRPIIVLPEYLFVVLRSTYIQELLRQGASQTTNIANVSLAKLRPTAVPLPPLEEQKRIVSKVDELMRLCDRLEAQQQEREKLLPLLSRANHTRFVTEPTASHLESLFQQPRISSTEDLRNTVLTLGVTGRLTQRLANDDSAMTLLDELREQQSLLHEVIVGRSRTAVSNAVLPDWTSILPDSWGTPLFDDVLVISSGITKGRNLSGRHTILLPYLRVANVQRWRLSLEQMKEIEVLEDEREKYRLLRGDVVMIEGGDWDKLGRAAIWNEEVEDCVFQNHIFRVRSPDKAKLLPEWVVLFVNSPLGREYFESCSKQTTNLASINMTQLRACRLPLPSTAEQKRIVQKVKYLLELVDRLEGKKSVAVETGQLFAAAAVVAITSTEFTEKERMKPPKTEVVTALKVGRKPKNAALAPLAALLAAEISLAPPKAAARADANRELTAKELWQLSGLEIDAFYRQLKIEMANDWIKEDGKKRAVKEVEAQ
jgi:type I restriction enzyme S subunit